MYCALCEPILRYGCEPCEMLHIRNIENLQEKILRIVLPKNKKKKLNVSFC